MNKINKQRGLTLIEIMIAMLISLLLLAGVSQLFINNKKTYRTLEGLSHVQESGRFAMEFLTRDIRNADFWGCMKNPNFSDCGCSGCGTNHQPGSTSGRICNHVDSTNPAYGNYNSGGVVGTDNTGLNGSDTLTLRGAFDAGIFVKQVPATPSANLKVSLNSGLAIGDVLIASDCQMGEIFAVTNLNVAGGFDNIVHNTGGGGTDPDNTYQAFQKKYGRDAGVYKYAELTYSLAVGANGEPALFRSENGVNSEFVSGIENMQLQYGVDIGNNGNIDYYDNGTNVENDGVWDQVVSVRVTLTARSPEANVSADGKDYLRKNYVSTVGVRNRLN